MDRCHTNQCLKSHEITSHLNQLPLLSDCMTFSKPLLCRQMKLTSSTQLSICVLQNEEDLRFVTKRNFFFTVLIRGRKGDLIEGEAASSQS